MSVSKSFGWSPGEQLLELITNNHYSCIRWIYYRPCYPHRLRDGTASYVMKYLSMSCLEYNTFLLRMLYLTKCYYVINIQYFIIRKLDLIGRQIKTCDSIIIVYDKYNLLACYINIFFFSHVLRMISVRLQELIRRMFQSNKTAKSEMDVEQMNTFKEAIQLKRHDRRYSVAIRHDNARPNLANMTKHAIKELYWDVLPPSTPSPALKQLKV